MQTSDIPNPWYAGTDYTLPVYVELTGVESVTATLTVTVPEENFSYSDRISVKQGESAFYNVPIKFDATGPATLVLNVKPPAGYVDSYKVNNKVGIPITVMLKP
jgi:hypothetical protein